MSKRNMLTTRRSRVLKQVILLCLCISALVGIWLLSKAGTSDFYSGFRFNLTNQIFVNSGSKRSADAKNTLIVNDHPKNVLTAFKTKAEKLILYEADANILGKDSKEKMDGSKIPTSEPVLNNFNVGEGNKVGLELFGVDFDSHGDPCYEAHIFYYPWYGNPKTDGRYIHWNHPFLPHWNEKEAKKWPRGEHEPPDDVGANFYPLLGPYSSKDPEVVDKHMQMIRYANIGVLVVSWYPPGDADNQGLEPDALMPLILDAAHKYKLKVALHIEPFKDRNHVTMRTQLRYIFDRYADHPAFYRTSFKNKNNLPLLYIYDSYLVESNDWKEIFSEGGSVSVRNTELDAIFIGLLVESKHERHITESKFDGFYTYFATNGFTFGSSWRNWADIDRWAKSKGLMFIPSVGPGYIDTEVRPWNGQNTRKRLAGKYYEESFTNTLKLKPATFSITSFNEWHEGTQIEPAVKKSSSKRSYLEYEPGGPFMYLNMTRKYVDKYKASQG